MFLRQASTSSAGGVGALLISDTTIVEWDDSTCFLTSW